MFKYNNSKKKKICNDSKRKKGHIILITYMKKQQHYCVICKSPIKYTLRGTPFKYFTVISKKYKLLYCFNLTSIFLV